ncbi:hypothetical protein EON66_03285 [archaeon]|nr:MAG: hypothetical protein EON66_03285 [archaeon]
MDAHCSNWNAHAGGEGGDASAEEAKKDGGVGSVTLRGVEDGEEHSLASPATVLSLDLVTEYVKSKLMPLFRAQQLSREEYKNVAKLSVKRAAAYLSTKLRVRVERQDVSTAHAAAQLDKPMKKLILKAVHSELVTVAGERVAAGVLGSDA